MGRRIESGEDGVVGRGAGIELSAGKQICFGWGPRAATSR